MEKLLYFHLDIATIYAICVTQEDSNEYRNGLCNDKNILQKIQAYMVSNFIYAVRGSVLKKKKKDGVVGIDVFKFFNEYEDCRKDLIAIIDERIETCDKLYEENEKKPIKDLYTRNLYEIIKNIVLGKNFDLKKLIKY